MATTLNPFREALRKLQARVPVGGDLSSAEWRDMPAALRERAFFSARVANARYVQEIKSRVESILNPVTVMRDGKPVTQGMTVASARAELKQVLKALSYNPGDKADTIQDLSSDSRLELQLKTNVESAQGFGNFLQGQAEGAIDAFPAQELFRMEGREEPRKWMQRWIQAGGATFDGRMIALKSDPVWYALGDKDRFPDALGNPYPPFAFNSGMWVRDIDRAEAEKLGLIRSDEKAEATVERFNARLKASVKDLDADLLESLRGSFGDQIVMEGDAIRWRGAE